MIVPESPASVPTMLPHYEGGLPGLYESLGPHGQPQTTRFMFKVPRVVADQKHKFENDDLFKRLSRESEVSLLIKI